MWALDTWELSDLKVSESVGARYLGVNSSDLKVSESVGVRYLGVNTSYLKVF